MRGMNRFTGKPIEGVAHIKQSIADILTTRVGSRVEVRPYGSDLPDRVDDPQNELLDVELYSDTAKALDTYEPRFKLESVLLTAREPGGHVTITVIGYLTENGEALKVEGITL